MPPKVDSAARALLLGLGHAVRERRKGRGWTIAQLAATSGVSARFLADVETGRGNISIVRLAELATALGCRPAELLVERGPVRLSLLGLRGAGKSTVGKLVAQKLGVAFVELDARVEEAAGLPLAEIFAVHGEGYYRRLERDVLSALLAGPTAFVLAAGGGLVNDATTFDLLRRGSVTVWLRAKPEEHMARVAAQGDLRPMARRSDAMADLRALLAARAPLYAQSDHTVDTTGVPVGRVVERVAGLVVT